MNNSWSKLCPHLVYGENNIEQDEIVGKVIEMGRQINLIMGEEDIIEFQSEELNTDDLINLRYH